mmetsp:Transcript_6338/g.15254  ORF Transcript_6338/g.15254 Transcript_6338/m.15254 type:complete len:228 (+) Transcript_6338:235-918(+)
MTFSGSSMWAPMSMPTLPPLRCKTTWKGSKLCGLASSSSSPRRPMKHRVQQFPRRGRRWLSYSSASSAAVVVSDGRGPLPSSPSSSCSSSFAGGEGRSAMSRCGLAASSNTLGSFGSAGRGTSRGGGKGASSSCSAFSSASRSSIAAASSSVTIASLSSSSPSKGSAGSASAGITFASSTNIAKHIPKVSLPSSSWKRKPYTLRFSRSRVTLSGPAAISVWEPSSPT